MKKLLRLAVLGGVVFGITKLMQAKKAEWQGLSEPEVRAKLDAKLSSRVPAEKLGAIQDGVVEKMRSRGMLAEETEAAAEAAGEAAAEAADEAPAETS
jgi:hypothetical protein